MCPVPPSAESQLMRVVPMFVVVTPRRRPRLMNA
jgi:hypothetical protein